MIAEVRSLIDLPNRAADYLAAHGWTQNTMRDSDGRVCLTGALKFCDPLPGDFPLARAVYDQLGRAEKWNDERGRTDAEVLAALRHDITDEDLESTFGPNWLGVTRLVRRVAKLDAEEIVSLAAARASAPDATQVAVWGAAQDATQVAARASAQDAAWDAVWDAAMDAASDAAVDADQLTHLEAGLLAVWRAAAGIVVRDVITTSQFNAMTQPWVAVLGPTWDEDE